MSGRESPGKVRGNGAGTVPAVLTGFTDEAASGIEGQIEICRQLGWRHIDLRAVDGVNIVNLDEREFDRICELLETAGLEVASFGSEIANWGRRIDESFDRDLGEIERAIPRMHRLNVRMIRIMSYRTRGGAVGEDPDTEGEILRRLREIVKRAEDGGVVCIHENCETWGGQSPDHTKFLLEGIDSPAFRLVFDTGNPFATHDRRGRLPHRYQDSLDFYREVKKWVEYVHIKDGRMNRNEAVYTYPGEGDGRIPELLAELRRDGYTAGFSIEPHVAVIFHDPSVTAAEEYRRESFIEYAHRTEGLLRAAGYDPVP